MKKRILSSVLVCICAFSLFSCGEPKGGDNSGNTSSSASQTETAKCTDIEIAKDSRKIEITDEIGKKVNDFFSETNTKKKQNVKLEIITDITVYFSTGEQLVFGTDKGSIVLYRKSADDKGYFIEISDEFNEYVHSLK